MKKSVGDTIAKNRGLAIDDVLVRDVDGRVYDVFDLPPTLQLAVANMIISSLACNMDIYDHIAQGVMPEKADDWIEPKNQGRQAIVVNINQGKEKE